VAQACELSPRMRFHQLVRHKARPRRVFHIPGEKCSIETMGIAAVKMLAFHLCSRKHQPADLCGRLVRLCKLLIPHSLPLLAFSIASLMGVPGGLQRIQSLNNVLCPYPSRFQPPALPDFHRMPVLKSRPRFFVTLPPLDEVSLPAPYRNHHYGVRVNL
jgi:hypothetical protein